MLSSAMSLTTTATRRPALRLHASTCAMCVSWHAPHGAHSRCAAGMWERLRRLAAPGSSAAAIRQASASPWHPHHLTLHTTTTPPPVGQHVAQQGGFACTQEATEQRDRQGPVQRGTHTARSRSSRCTHTAVCCCWRSCTVPGHVAIGAGAVHGGVVVPVPALVLPFPCCCPCG